MPGTNLRICPDNLILTSILNVIHVFPPLEMKKLSQTLCHVSYILTWKLPSSQLGKQKGSPNSTVRHYDMLNSNAPKDFRRLNYEKWRKIQMNNWVTNALVSKLCFTLFLSLNQVDTDNNPSNIEYNACVNIQVF